MRVGGNSYVNLSYVFTICMYNNNWSNGTIVWNIYILTVQIGLLQGEWKPLHTKFNYTLLQVQIVRATTTTVTTKIITRPRKIKTWTSQNKCNKP